MSRFVLKILGAGGRTLDIDKTDPVCLIVKVD